MIKSAGGCEAFLIYSSILGSRKDVCVGNLMVRVLPSQGRCVIISSCNFRASLQFWFLLKQMLFFPQSCPDSHSNVQVLICVLQLFTVKSNREKQACC